MTLALGTALQNGTYVIDALSGEDSIGPLYLATHVPSGRWVLVRVLGSRHPEALPEPGERDAFYQHLATLSQLGQAILPGHLHGFEEDRVCYQTFSQPQGSPLSSRVTTQNPMPLSRSLALVRQLAQDLQGLRPLNWVGLRLTPDQIWQAGAGEQLTLTGLDFPEMDGSSQLSLDPSQNEARMVRGLAALLYFLLTGQWVAPNQDSLAAELRHYRPELPTSLQTAFQVACLPLAEIPGLAQWAAQLPHPDDAAQAASPIPQPSSSPSASPNFQPVPSQSVATMVVAPAAPATRTLGAGSSPPPSRRGLGRRPWALMATGILFGLGGVSLGLQARLQPNSPAVQSRFNPNQAFPPLPDWESPSPSFNNPTVENRRARNRPNPAAEEIRPSLIRPAPAPSIPPSAPVLRDPVPIADPQPTPSFAPPAPSPGENEIPRYGGTPEVVDSPPPTSAPVDRTPEPAAPPTAIEPTFDPVPPVPIAPAPVAPAPVAPAPVAPDPVLPDPVAPPPPAPPAPLTSS